MRAVSEQEAEQWLQDNAPYLEMKEWGGKGSVNSVFYNKEYGHTLHLSFCSVRDAVKQGKYVGSTPGKTTKEEAVSWLQENAPHLDLVEWAGTASKKSVFYNRKLEDYWEVALKTLKNRLSSNPESFLGAGKSWKCRTLEEAQEILKSVDIDILEWGGTFASTSLFINKETGVKFSRPMSSLLRELTISPERKFGCGPGGNNKKTSLEGQQALLERYSDRYEIVSYSPHTEGKSVYKDRETGETFEYYNTSLLSSLQNNGSFVVGRACSSLEARGRELIPENVRCEYNTLIPGTRHKPDIIISDHKIIVECDGLFWHDEDHRTKKYHSNKKNSYNNAGYKSFFFREDELLRKFSVCKSMVLNALFMSTVVPARKCSVEEIVPEFFEENHLMGKGAGPCFGLVYKGSVVAGIQTKWVNKADSLLDISRFCTSLNTSVVGGFSKLVNHVSKLYSPKTIQTYVDLRYGQGNHLEYLGFVHKGTHLSFKWTDHKNTYHRMKFPKNTGYDHGYVKLWDCGQAKWVKNCE